jgi:hypothetical protein
LIGLEAIKDIEKDEIVDFSKVKYKFKMPNLEKLGLVNDAEEAE